MGFKTIAWKRDRVLMIDQRLLPGKEVYREYRDFRGVASAIRKMVIRGAPAIGVAAAYGLALAAKGAENRSREKFFAALKRAAKTLEATRPTAVNLSWAIERMMKLAEKNRENNPKSIARILEREAIKMHQQDIVHCKAMGLHGAKLLKNRSTVLTHCNAGALATCGWGTALGVIRSAVKAGKKIRVLADETRPFLQGARLTAWELMKDGIDVTLITDNMAGYFMRLGEVDAVVVGADRVAANGDVANKIGTYGVAVLAKENRIPFYVAAPTSTIDLEKKGGGDIPIEERDPKEITCLGGKRIAPEGVMVMNPAFDITPARYISAIITERGVARPPYSKSIKKLF